MALAENLEFEKDQINQTWILSDINPRGWHYSSEKIDILKFSNDSNLEMISIEEGSIGKIKYEIDDNKEIILDSGLRFGKIKTLTKERLIIQHGNEGNPLEKIYSLLPKTELEILESEMVKHIRQFNWKSTNERPTDKSNMVWSLGEFENGVEFEIQLTAIANKRKIVMPAEIKSIGNCLFLSCQIPELFSPTNRRENYLITKITENKIQIKLGLTNEQSILIFEREE